MDSQNQDKSNRTNHCAAVVAKTKQSQSQPLKQTKVDSLQNYEQKDDQFSIPIQHERQENPKHKKEPTESGTPNKSIGSRSNKRIQDSIPFESKGPEGKRGREKKIRVWGFLKVVQVRPWRAEGHFGNGCISGRNFYGEKDMEGSREPLTKAGARCEPGPSTS